MEVDSNRGLDRRRFLRHALWSTAGACVGSIVVLGKDGEEREPGSLEDLKAYEWGFVVDTTRCIGCGACVRACKTENAVPDSYFRTWVERYEIDEHEQVKVDSPDGALDSFKADRPEGAHVVKAFFVPKLCNLCEHSPCAQVCPVDAG